MRKRIGVVLALVGAAACREPIPVDPERSVHIPSEVAVAKLREVLPAAEVVVCTAPRSIWTGAEIAEWKIDEKRVEYVPRGKEPAGFSFADVTSMRLDRLGGTDFQVRVFTPAQANPKKDYIHFDYKSEERARQAYECLEALRRK
jgi:hypothetical protein